MANNPNAAKNLIPAKKGEVRNPKGRPKGVTSWATIVKRLLADTELVDKVVKQKPTWWESLPTKRGADAVVVAMMVQAMKGDVQAANWLRKTGFNDVVDDEPEEHNTLIFINEVPNRQEKRRTIDAEGIDGDL